MADSYSSPNEYIGHHLAFNELKLVIRLSGHLI
jgi:hypothetical protein